MDTENVQEGSVVADQNTEVLPGNPDAGTVSVVDVMRLLREIERKVDVLVDNSVNAALLAKRQVRGALA